MILPTFNRAGTLSRAVASVLAQTHEALELIIVDDGSTDATGAIVSSLEDHRVRYIKLERNAGQSAARNAGLRASRGTLVAFQDSDDIWLPEKLAKQVASLKGNPGLAGVYCDLDRRRLNGHSLVIEAPTLKTGRYLDERPSLYQTFGLGIQSCLFRREVLLEVEGFREDLRCFEDLELLLRIAARHPLKRIPEALVLYFETHGSVSNQVASERQARIHLLRRYGIWGIASHPINVAVELARCLGRQEALSRWRAAARRVGMRWP